MAIDHLAQCVIFFAKTVEAIEKLSTIFSTT